MFIRISLIFIMVLVLCPATTRAAPPARIDFLLYFFDMNEVAFAYHRHCLRHKGDINGVFLETLEFVADEMFSEAKKNEPREDPDYIKSKILDRRYNIQYKLDVANMKDGCYSPDSLKASEHYQEFSVYGISDIRKFIDKSTSAE